MAILLPPQNYGLISDTLHRSGEPQSQANLLFLERLRLRTVLYLGPDEPGSLLTNWCVEQGVLMVRLQQISSSTSHNAMENRIIAATHRTSSLTPPPIGAPLSGFSGPQPPSTLSSAMAAGNSATLLGASSNSTIVPSPILTSGSHSLEDQVLQALHYMCNPSYHPLLVISQLGRHRTGLVVGCFRKLQRWNLASIFAEYRRFSASKPHPRHEQFIELFDTDLVSASPLQAELDTL